MPWRHRSRSEITCCGKGGAPWPNSPWSARVSRAVSCVSRETVLEARNTTTPHPPTRLCLLRVLQGADDADETSALPVRIARSGLQSFHLQRCQLQRNGPTWAQAATGCSRAHQGVEVFNLQMVTHFVSPHEAFRNPSPRQKKRRRKASFVWRCDPPRFRQKSSSRVRLGPSWKRDHGPFSPELAAEPHSGLTNF